MQKETPETSTAASTTATTVPVYQQVRSPAIFSGDTPQDPEKWLKEFERVAKYNRWDEMMCLANAYFFLASTARQWYENNEEHLSSWLDFQNGIKAAFGDSQQLCRRAEDELKVRAQKPGETTQSYIQDILALCQ